MPLDQKRNSRNDKPLQSTLSLSKPSILIKYAVNIRFIFHGEIIATPKTIYKCCILPLTTSSSEICKGITSIQYTANFLALILQWSFVQKYWKITYWNYVDDIQWGPLSTTHSICIQYSVVIKKKVIEFFALHENTFKMIPNHISFDKYWCCFTSFQTKKKLKYIG